MSEAAATGATPDPNTGETPVVEPKEEVTPDPREEALGDPGKALLKEMRDEIKELRGQLKGVVDESQADKDAKAKAKADKDAAAAKAAKEKEDAEKTELDLVKGQLSAVQERLVRADFMEAVAEAGIRDGQSALDLYSLVKSEIEGDPDRIESIVAKQLESRPNFFVEKKKTKGHDGGAGGGKIGPKLSDDEKAAAKMFGMTEEAYAKERDSK